MTDEFDVIRTYANDPIVFTLDGPAEIIGDNPFSLIVGTGAIWIRTRERAGTVRLTAKHPRLGSHTVNFTLHAVPSEAVKTRGWRRKVIYLQLRVTFSPLRQAWRAVDHSHTRTPGMYKPATGRLHTFDDQFTGK